MRKPRLRLAEWTAFVHPQVQQHSMMSSPSPAQAAQSMLPPPQPSPQPPASQPNSARSDPESQGDCDQIGFCSHFLCHLRHTSWLLNLLSLLPLLIPYIGVLSPCAALVPHRRQGASSQAPPPNRRRALPTLGPFRTTASRLQDRSTLQVVRTGGCSPSCPSYPS